MGFLVSLCLSVSSFIKCEWCSNYLSGPVVKIKYVDTDKAVRKVPIYSKCPVNISGYFCPRYCCLLSCDFKATNKVPLFYSSPKSRTSPTHLPLHHALLCKLSLSPYAGSHPHHQKKVHGTQLTVWLNIANIPERGIIIYFHPTLGRPNTASFPRNRFRRKKEHRLWGPGMSGWEGKG